MELHVMLLLGLWSVAVWPSPTVAASPPKVASLCDAGDGWSVAWQDEFDAALNRSVWAIPVGVGSSLGREANVTEEDTYVQDGMLVRLTSTFSLATHFLIPI